ncbi:MAG: hypothetical protein Q7V53_02835 [Caldisericota bacterium]|nr:hypothetical protein [Caldisericota bacterium]
MSECRTFIELTVTESGLSNVPVPRRFLVDAALIASVEDIDGNPHARTHVTLHQPSDSTAESESGEQVVRASKTLTALDSYDEIKAKLADAAAVVLPSNSAVESILAAAKDRARKRKS